MVNWSKTFGLTIVTLFLIGLASSSMSVLTLGQGQVENTWTTVAPLPKSHLSPALGTTLDGQIYLIGYDIAERYDPVSDKWTTIASLPQETGGAVAACQNKIYVIGHITQVYDPVTNSWANKTSIPPSLSGTTAAVVGDKIYFISGGTATYIIENSNTTYVYDTTTDSWSTMAPIPTPVQSYACAVLNNKIYIIGGAQMPKSENWSEGLKASNLVQIFDTQTNQWTAGTPLPFGVTGAEGCAKLGINATKLIYVMGGYSSIRLMGTLSKPPNPTLLNQVYNPVTGVWSLEGSVPDIQWSFSLVNINDVFYAVGGYDKGSITLNNGQTTGGQTTQRYIPLGYASNAYPSSTSTVPEFSYLTILPILLAITIILAIVRKRFQENV